MISVTNSDLKLNNTEIRDEQAPSELAVKTDGIRELTLPYRFDYRAGDRTRKRFVPFHKNQSLGRSNPHKGVFALNREKLLQKNRKSPLLALEQELAVKTGDKLQNEYQLGSSLTHPNIVKIHVLVSRLPKRSKGEIRQFMVMDRVRGRTMGGFLPKIARKIPNDVVQQMVVSFKDCCLHLFDKEIAWVDVNEGNIMLENKTHALKLIDFEFWHQESNPTKLTFKLLLGSLEGVGWILKASTLRRHHEPTEKVLPFIYPQSFLGDIFAWRQVFSYLGMESYKDAPQLCDCLKVIENIGDNRQGLKDYLASYFDAVQGLLETEFKT